MLLLRWVAGRLLRWRRQWELRPLHKVRDKLNEHTLHSLPPTQPNIEPARSVSSEPTPPSPTNLLISLSPEGPSVNLRRILTSCRVTQRAWKSSRLPKINRCSPLVPSRSRRSVAEILRLFAGRSVTSSILGPGRPVKQPLVMKPLLLRRLSALRKTSPQSLPRNSNLLFDTLRQTHRVTGSLTLPFLILPIMTRPLLRRTTSPISRLLILSSPLSGAMFSTVVRTFRRGVAVPGLSSLVVCCLVPIRLSTLPSMKPPSVPITTVLPMFSWRV